MNILVIGNGGREHALAWKIKQSNACSALFVAPGNAGTTSVATNVNIKVDDFEALGEFCLQSRIEMVVVGPEVPLVLGIRDYFEEKESLRSILIVGPGRKGAQLEGSKDFSKAFMKRHGIPTAHSNTFDLSTLEEGFKYLETLNPPYVLKADGLAAGKGVVISAELEAAKKELREMLEHEKFGKASSKVVVEEFLTGIELSVFVLTDGKNYVILPEAKDYKRIGEQDSGPNTGGMGAVTPVPFADATFMGKVEKQVIVPTIQGLQHDQIPYCGFIFIGLMNVGGEPFVIEYNVRMGDPETQAVIPRIKSDLVVLLQQAAKGILETKSLEVDPDFYTTVVMVSGGYPGEYEKGKEIKGLDQVENSMVFHAGSAQANGKIVTSGGRVLAATGKASTLENALEHAYSGISKISWEDAYFRKDIGQDLLKLD